jgi:prepilin-type N-terminal cleavage/methylation domain-containing protein
MKTAPASGRWPARRAGFTLIEIIAALVLGAVLVPLMLPLFGFTLLPTITASQVAIPYDLRVVLDAWIALAGTTFAGNLADLQTFIAGQAGLPGADYTLVANDFIGFDNDGNQISDPGEGQPRFLLVTISHPLSGALSYVFAP